MKTFEERYTAWIDGELEGSALTSFEQELARRSAEGEAESDKADASLLRALLQDHLQAPSLTNADFFNHQIRERIDAELAASTRGREKGREAAPGIFAWGFARLAGLGSACLFAAAALYYGMMPSHSGVVSAPGYAVSQPAHPTLVATDDSPTPAAHPAAPADPNAPVEFVQLSPTPAFDLSVDVRAHVPDQPSNPTSVTPLHYNQPNVNVLWLNGLDYMPSVPNAEAGPGGASPAATNAPPAASAAPAAGAPGK